MTENRMKKAISKEKNEKDRKKEKEKEKKQTCRCLEYLTFEQLRIEIEINKETIYKDGWVDKYTKKQRR